MILLDQAHFCSFLSFTSLVMGMLELQQQEDEEMLVPHSDLVEGPQPLVEGPQPMEGLVLSYVVLIVKMPV